MVAPGSTQSPSSSNQGTPTSSTTALNDIRNKPLPPGENGMSRAPQGNPIHPSPQGTPNTAPSGGNFIPSQSGMGGVSGQGGAGGPATPTRGHGIPGVVISPSSGNAPVRSLTAMIYQTRNHYFVCVSLVSHSNDQTAHSTSWCCGDYAWRPCSTKTGTKIRCFRSVDINAKGRARRHPNAKATTLFKI